MRGRWIALMSAAVAAVLLGVMFGAAASGPSALVEAWRDPASPTATIILQLRLPRVILAFLVGAGLGVSGAVLQALVRNSLADPYLLGLSGGAGLGAVLAIAVAAASAWIVPVAAFVGALLAVALVYRLSVVAGKRLDPRILLLSGVVVGAFAGALMSAIIVLSPADALRNAMLWLLGGFGTASWQSVLIFVGYGAAPFLVLLTQSRRLDLLSLGEEPAQFLGADVERTKRIVYLSASLLTAVAVAVSGVIGFVGLVIPHAVRLLMGTLHRTLLPAVILAAGAFLVLADLLARTVVAPVDLPVGVVTALIGVPIFATLLRRSVQ